MRWVFAAGTVCCPFSRVSVYPAWCDESTLSTLTFCFIARYFEANDIINECVAGFHANVFTEQLRKTNDILKCPSIATPSPSLANDT